MVWMVCLQWRLDCEPQPTINLRDDKHQYVAPILFCSNVKAHTNISPDLAACGGGITWSLLEYLHTRKFSIIGFCSGIISGLVGITPAAGFTPIYVAALIGLLTATCCFYTNKYKYLLSIDEGLDIFAIHGVGGYVGDILTGFFAASWVPALDGKSGTTYAGGWWEGNWIQLEYQFAGATTCAGWAFGVSCVLLFIIDRIPGCHLRETEEDEIRGLDYKYLADADYEWFAGHMATLEGVPASGGESQRSVERTVEVPMKTE